MIKYRSTQVRVGSCLLRLGRHCKPAISVCGIPVTKSRKYLGGEIGQKADKPGKLYGRVNQVIVHNSELIKCNIGLKQNSCAYTLW